MHLPTIGFVGLGMMGAGIAGCLLRAGYPLVVSTHRSRAAAGRLIAQGAAAADSLAALTDASDVKAARQIGRAHV